MDEKELNELILSKCHRVPLYDSEQEFLHPTGILVSEYSRIKRKILGKDAMNELLKDLNYENIAKALLFEVALDAGAVNRYEDVKLPDYLMHRLAKHLRTFMDDLVSCIACEPSSTKLENIEAYNNIRNILTNYFNHL